jgi:hypothetical protein
VPETAPSSVSSLAAKSWSSSWNFLFKDGGVGSAHNRPSLVNHIQIRQCFF